jgi:DNA-binding response OmpR family regulator
MNDYSVTVAGRRVVLVEENAFLAGYLATVLREAGLEVLGPAGSVVAANALLAAQPMPDAAVISADVFEAEDFSGAAALVDAGVPILLTARRAQMRKASGIAHSILVAPFAGYQVVDHVRRVLQVAPAAG